MIRYAIWCAVSTTAQAERGEKVSLEVQEEKCRQAGASRGWKEMAGPYIVRGESRQKYVNLRDAEMEIPELHQLLEDAQGGKYDVLITWDYNRFRDLLDLVSKSLSHYHVQIASVSQWIEPVAPGKYNPYASDASTFMQVMSKMTSTLQNNDLRRKYQEAMPRRVSQRGLPATSIPWGYIRGANSKVPPTLDPDLVPILIELKDKFLASQSTTQLAEWLATVTPPPKGRTWWPQTVKAILVNPFYAGILRWGMTRAELDPRSGLVHKNRRPNPENIVTGKGKHEPVWDEYTHHAILSEFRKRGHAYAGRVTQRLTSILTCGVCGRNLWAYYNNTKTPANLVWRCSSREEHVALRDIDALRLVEMKLVNDLMRLDPQAPAQSDETSRLRDDLAELQSQRSRIGDAYDAGAYDLVQLAERTGPLDDRIAELKHKLSGAELLEQDMEARARAIYFLKENVSHMPAFVETGAVQEVNHTLRAVLKEIIVYGGEEIELKWK